MPKRGSPPGTFWRGGLLWGRIQIKGQDVRWSLRTSDPKLARERLKADRDRLVAQGHYGATTRRLFDEVLAEWARHIPDQVGPRTARRYACSLHMLQPFLTGKHLDEINGALVAEIIRKRGTVDAATNATVKRDLVALSSVFNFAIDQGWAELNPVLPRMKRLKERRDPIVLPEPDHIVRIMTRAPGLLSNLIEVAWKTGCRLDELVTAKRTQVDHSRRELRIIGKGNKIRVIDLNPFGAYDAIGKLPVSLGAPWLFWHGQGEPYRNLSSRFRGLCVELAGRVPDFRPFRFHDLRHRHAVDWLQSGRSIYDLQHGLGHTSIKTTEVYLQYLTAEQGRAVKDGTKAGTAAT